MPQGKKLDESVLSVEEFTRLRRDEGLSFEAIGKRIGYAGGTVGAYARRVLPSELWGRGERSGKKTKPVSRMDQIKAELKKAREEAEGKVRRELTRATKCEEVDKEASRGTKPIVTTSIVQAPAHDEVAKSALVHFAQNCLGEGLFVAAGGNDTAAALISGPGGLEDLLVQQRSHQAWCDFLAGLAPKGELDRLASLVPPFYVRNEADRQEYLQQIAAGYVVATRRAREAARRFLAGEGRPVLDRFTVRKLEVLARLARWLIAREKGSVR
jgi:hypothetical protein